MATKRLITPKYFQGQGGYGNDQYQPRDNFPSDYQHQQGDYQRGDGANSNMHQGGGNRDGDEPMRDEPWDSVPMDQWDNMYGGVRAGPPPSDLNRGGGGRGGRGGGRGGRGGPGDRGGGGGRGRPVNFGNRSGH